MTLKRYCRHCKTRKFITDFFLKKTGYSYKCIDCRNIKPKDRIKANFLKHKYNLSLDDYKLMLVDQNNCCYICSNVFKKTPYVDHCHTTDQVRGLLCQYCNTGLGMFKDNIDNLYKAIDYLKKSNKINKLKISS